MRLEKERKIYLDMDGVFVDFDIHFEKLHGFHPSRFKDDNTGFWKQFDTKRDGFFRDSPPFDGHLGFLDYVLQLADEYDYGVEMLTALPRRSTHPTAKEEKQDWMHMHGMGHITMNVGPYAIDKQHWYRHGDILIDDKELNINQWRAKGGEAIWHEPGNFPSSMAELKTIVTHPPIPVRFP